MDLGFEVDRCVMCLPVEEHTTTSGFTNGLNLSLIRPRDLAVNLQKILETEEHVELPHESAISKIQTE